MRPPKIKAKKPNESTPKAHVVSLSAYRPDTVRDVGLSTPIINRNLLTRHNQVAEHIQSSTEGLAPTAVAAALVVLRSDGTLDTSAIGTEPEYLPFLLRGLDQIASRLAAPSPYVQPKHRNQHGAAIISIALTLAYAAATYINEYAWLDALLTIAAQISAICICDRSHNDHSI